jgi:hypothetical protein
MNHIDKKTTGTEIGGGSVDNSFDLYCGGSRFKSLLDTGYPDPDFRGFPQSLQANALKREVEWPLTRPCRFTPDKTVRVPTGQEAAWPGLERRKISGL